MKKLSVLIATVALTSCAPVDVKEGYRKWHETGKLYVMVDESIRSLVREEAEDAIGRWVECGTEYQKRLPKVVIIGEAPLEPPKPGWVTCGIGIMNGTMLILNSDYTFFIWNKACVSYQHTVGHELAHLMGYGHDTDKEYEVFEARMAICGFPMGQHRERPNLPSDVK